MPDTTTEARRIPHVAYLRLEPEPHLVAQRCTGCGAHFFDRRNACASCSGTSFEEQAVPTTGELRTFTIVSFAAPGVPVPFVAGVVDCGGVSVRGNVVDCPPDPDHVRLGMAVRLTTVDLGADSEGTHAVGFGFAPIDEEG